MYRSQSRLCKFIIAHTVCKTDSEVKQYLQKFFRIGVESSKEIKAVRTKVKENKKGYQKRKIEQFSFTHYMKICTIIY